MSVLSQVRGFLRALRFGTRRRPRHHGDAVGEAADSALGPRTYYDGLTGDYIKSFDKDD